VLGPTGITFQIIFCLYSAANAVMACYKLRKFIVAFGFNLSVPISCLLLELIASLERLFYTIDPLGFRGYYGRVVSQVFLSLGTPFTLSSTLLVTFYWQEVLTRWSAAPASSMRNVNKMKIPFIITSFIIFATELGGSLGRSYGDGFDTIFLVNGVSMAIVCLGTSIFFIVVGIKVLRTVNQVSSTRTKGVSRITKLLMVSGGSLIGFVVGIACVVLPSSWYTVGGTLASFSIAYFFINTASLSQIMAFEAPAVSKTPSDKHQNSNSNTNTPGTINVDVEMSSRGNT